MKTKRQEANPPTSITETSAGVLSKPSRAAWKTGEQLEYLLTHWTGYVTHQNKKTLASFWSRVYDGWYRKWPITPSIESMAKHGSREGAILALRSENNSRIRTWFHNRGRLGSKSGKSDLRLNQNEKRKLAPAQAYCTYAWGSGLRDVVIARWEEQKLTHMSADEDDPTADLIETPDSGPHIPIDFKLKIAKEVYNSLSVEERKKVDNRREEDRKRMYRSIPDIASAKERNKKLLKHKKNQPSVAKSLVRVLKNLEDQAGCVAHLLIGYVDPTTGVTTFQNFCQGKTDTGLEFDDYYGDEWENNVEKRFKDWAVAIVGEKDTNRRSMFLLSDAPLDEDSSGEGSPDEDRTTATASSSRIQHDAEAAEEPTEHPSGVDTIAIDEDRMTEESSIAPLPQIFETTQAPPPTLIPQPLVFETSGFVVPHEIFQPPQSLVFETPGFVVPHEIFQSPQSLEPAKTHPVNIPHPHVLTESPVITPTVAGSSQPVTPDQVGIPSVTHQPHHLVAPVLESSQTVITNQTVIPPIIYESASFITPALGSSQAAAPNQTANSTAVHESSSLVTPPLLESPQAVAPNQVVISPIYDTPLVNPPGVLGSSQAVTPQRVVSQKSVPLSTDPPHIIHKSQPAVVHSSSSPAGGNNLGPTVTAGGVYRPRDKVSVATTTRTRRDSIEGAPDIVLSLGGSGYELVDPLSPREPICPAENDTSVPPSTAPSSTPPSTTSSPTPSSTTPSTPSPESIIPSSQQSLEEELTIPTSIPAASGTTTTVSGRFRYALRVIPTYDIDRSDLPSWLTERGRLDYVLSVEAGELWGKLITTWIRQERRLGFGLNEQLGASLSLKRKPGIFKDYFKWHHNPSKGDSVAFQELGDEMSVWWSSIQPEWRYREEHSSDDRKDYSYILAGGKKGVFLLVLCLAWWDRAYGRNLEEEKTRRREAARAAGTDEAAVDFSDLHEHEYKWFNIVNDLLFVMELAQGWPAPGESTSGAVGVVPVRRKRGAEQGEGSASRKKKKSS